jgi:hypothetical protein
VSTKEIDLVFASGLRNALNAQVHETTRRRRRWRWSLGLGVVIGSSVVAGGAALAAVLLSQPGARVDTPLANPVIVTRTGTATVDLGPPPLGATDISLTLTCHSAGNFYFPDGSSATCSAAEGRQGSQVSEVVPLATGQRTATIKASPGASWTLQAVYVNQITTSWGTNGRGETYGVFNQRGTPDLVAVTIDRGSVDGYVSSSDLSCASGGDVQSPAQALAWDRVSHDTNVVISVYESDGITVIGSFDVGDATGPDVRTVPLSSIVKEFCHSGPKSPSTANPGTTVQSPPTTATQTS